ncbi:hypothetical protein [Cellulomonas marina]|uniref:Uncharacterized protein n=1 Tax=Cellulomonas marina TaxID=988821 RepID=A0A1I1APR0_9CELL|nr:hypothetical protein [Cellulomonas marina]GIG29302.1 hypothetical protein Cma02nite_19020 [Cellulomonas marina]SFB40029.1 hypothetical protein SAMN05421867_12121 [Cellulomonas marina]
MAHLPTFTAVTVVDCFGVFECVLPTCSCRWRSGIACDSRTQAVAVHDIHARTARARVIRAKRRASRRRAA